MFFRTGYNYDTDKVSEETGVFFSGEDGMAQQQFKDDADINEIVRRFGLTGQLPENPRVPLSGDFTEVVDYETAMFAVRKAQEAFMEYPAELRAKFNNDPQALMLWADNPANKEEGIKLGVFAPEAEVDRSNVVVAPVVTT